MARTVMPNATPAATATPAPEGEKRTRRKVDHATESSDVVVTLNPQQYAFFQSLAAREGGYIAVAEYQVKRTVPREVQAFLNAAINVASKQK